MDKKTRQTILQTPSGRELNALVESKVFGRANCLCGPIGGYDADTGMCSRCQVPPAPQWSDSHAACHYLLVRMREKCSYQERQRFLDFLGEALAFRLQVGKIDPRQWLLHAQPEDVARAAVLTCSE